VAGLEVTEATRAFPHLEHPKSLLEVNPYLLEQTNFDRHQNATELKESTPPFTSSPATGKAARRPAPNKLQPKAWLQGFDMRGSPAGQHRPARFK